MGLTVNAKVAKLSLAVCTKQFVKFFKLDSYKKMDLTNGLRFEIIVQRKNDAFEIHRDAGVVVERNVTESIIWYVPLFS